MNRILTYNASGQVTSVNRVGASNLSYQYDALGRRTQATNGANTTNFLIAPAAQRLGAGALDVEQQHLATNDSGQLLQGWIYAGENPILRYDDLGNVEYYLESANDSIAALVNSGANIVAEYEFDAFGNSLNGVQPTSAAGGDFGFHAAWRDNETGLHHVRARTYDPETGRFLSVDPAEPNEQIPESYHPYSFANNNPHLYSDPTGLFSITEINVSGAIQRSLNGFKTAAVNQAREFITDKALEFATDLLFQGLIGLLPGGIINNAVSLANTAQQAGQFFGAGARGIICNDSLQHAAQYSRFEVPIDPDTGHPTGNGFGCGSPDVDNPYAGGRGVRNLPNGRRPIRPDLILGPPSIVENLTANQNKTRSNKSYTAVEFKLSVTTLLDETKPFSRQFRGIGDYTSRHTTTGKVAVFVTLLGRNRGSAGSADTQMQLAIKNLFDKGILGVVIRLTNITNTF